MNCVLPDRVFGSQEQIPVADQPINMTLGLRMEMKAGNNRLASPTKGESPERLVAEPRQLQFSRRFGADQHVSITGFLWTN